MKAAAPSLPLAPGQPYESRDGHHHVIVSVRDDEQTGAPLIFLRDEQTGGTSVETTPTVFLTCEPAVPR